MLSLVLLINWANTSSKGAHQYKQYRRLKIHGKLEKIYFPPYLHGRITGIF